jgi:hypothetical protein
MPRLFAQFVALMLASAIALATAGCGTTRSTDTNRTATEQLLISNAIDKAVQSVDLKTLSGQTVFLDDSRLGEVVDRNYLISTLRQHILASGCNLKDQKDQADFVVEARAGAVGTDRNDLLFGVPSTNVPQIMPMQPVPAAVIPEIPLAKRRDQRGIAKLAVFAYHRETGTPVWQSGLVHQESSSNDVWILGAGPFQRGSIYDGTSFAGKEIGHDDDEEDETRAPPRRLPTVDLAEASVFTPPKKLMKEEAGPPASAPVAAPTAAQPVVQASHEASPPTAPASPPPAAAAPILATASPAEPPAGTAATQPAVPPTPAEPRSIYAPAGTSQLPHPRFESR